ncbi:hypothetical protein CPHO_09130 [Corynebacterium phocae]|uniref:IrrE N-terminal-like domain-containing protein n=1 Tax=Corynebacterium phocae TaxID=161895 RepID=A0A1L7D4D6_9CORY|nr:ImmA/IrrE family metallo-endopeptidase [Corynebacterium phocae]APT93019.1 hypothetical protein CPHO_09130 [Corynebacterium phocae]KAA8722507.1 ImmA/IrrE family metallo-endopeptidase [Corynebacterium phocae]
MAHVRVPISGPMVQWAVERTGHTAAELTTQAGFKQVNAWLEEKQHPTFEQAKRLAKKAGIPFGFLFLPEPVDLTPDLPDFRTRANNRISNISRELEEQIAFCQRSLSWYTDNATEFGGLPPEHLGSATVKNDPQAVAERMREIVGWDSSVATHGRTHVNMLADCLENYGLLVMKGSVVGNKTNAKLDTDEFRGFTLIDRGHALVFINTADAATANLFSLAHEFGHVLLGQQGVSSDNDHHQVERWCNQFAATLLLPEALLADAQFENPIDIEYLSKKSRTLGPSVEAIVWRLAALGFLEADRARELVRRWNSVVKPKKADLKTSGGPRPAVMTRSRLGRNFVEALSEAYDEGTLSYADAVQFTGYKRVAVLEKVLNLDAGER